MTNLFVAIAAEAYFLAFLQRHKDLGDCPRHRWAYAHHALGLSTEHPLRVWGRSLLMDILPYMPMPGELGWGG